MTFGGCKQDFMLVVGQSISTNASKDKPTEKHLFAMDASKVSERSDRGSSRTLVSETWSEAHHVVSHWHHEYARWRPLFVLLHQQIREITLLISSYVNSAHQQKAAAHHLSAPALMVAQPVSLKCKELRSKSPPALGRPSKAPTLLWRHKNVTEKYSLCWIWVWKWIYSCTRPDSIVTQPFFLISQILWICLIGPE